MKAKLGDVITFTGFEMGQYTVIIDPIVSVQLGALSLYNAVKSLCFTLCHFDVDVKGGKFEQAMMDVYPEVMDMNARGNKRIQATFCNSMSGQFGFELQVLDGDKE